ncbi:MAG: response regulator [Oceanococcus sp.]
MKFLVIEDSKVFAMMFRQMLEHGGHEAVIEIDSTKAMQRLEDEKPDCVLLDIMMPGVDGLTLLTQMRSKFGKSLKIIMVSAKAYEADKRKAIDLGASGYINKVSEREILLQRIEEIVQDQAKIRFWGVRGTLPVVGEASLRYGGNTSCISMQFADGRLFIFDAGSGIKNFSDHLMAKAVHPLKARVFISHPHIDHIQALPFFAPLFVKGNEFEVLGPAQDKKGMKELIAGQMDGVYFPVTMSEFAADVTYTDLPEGEFQRDGISIKTLLLNHPGHCLAYRVDYAGASFCYATDNELYPATSPYYNEDYRSQLAEFIRGVDYWVTDTTYMDEEYAAGKEHWGHSSISEVVEIADLAQVKTLCLFHHDPDQNDDAIDAKLAFAEQALRARGSSTQVIAPAMGDELSLSPVNPV